jgi:flagellar hook-associated protein 2
VAVSGVNSNGLNFTGLATGIDTAKIIDGLNKINQSKIDSLKAQQASLGTKQTTFVQLQAKLFDLQSKTAGLARSAGSAFDARKATSSDSTALAAAAGTAAIPGTYSLTVGSLAQAAQVSSDGFADPNAQLKQGTLTVQVGSRAATTVTIDSRNNTLQGLADAINSAQGDVRASIINDGTASPYRLVLNSTQTGASNTVSVTNNLTTGTGAAINPTARTVQAAADATVTLGSGAGAIVVQSASNQVNGLIPGVSLNLLSANPAKPVTLSVATDTESLSKSVQDFVTAYNAAVGFINDQSRFDPSTQTAGVLLGNNDAAALRNDLAAALSATIPGLGSAANRLSSVGLSFKQDGTLALDQGKLDRALSGQTGASVGDLKKLFALSGTSDNPGVQFAFGTDQTKPSGASGYGVQVTAPATRATVTASGPPAAIISINPPNNSLLLKLNGLASSDVTIPTGNYSPDELVAVIQQQINANAALNGNRVTVGRDGDGKFQITSQAYGSSSSVAFAGGTALGTLGFTGTETATGTDVVGSFTVGGQTEEATGSGQTLAGKPGNANTDGLRVNATATDPTSATVTVSQGFGARLNTVLNKYLNAKDGRLKSVNTTLQSRIDDLGKTITKQNASLQAKADQLTRQFAAMESSVNNLKGLQTQLASLATTKSSN